MFFVRMDYDLQKQRALWAAASKVRIRWRGRGAHRITNLLVPTHDVLIFHTVLRIVKKRKKNIPLWCETGYICELYANAANWGLQQRLRFVFGMYNLLCVCAYRSLLLYNKINSQLDATIIIFINNFNQLNMFRAILSSILWCTKGALKFHRMLLTSRQHRRCFILQAVNTD